MLLGTVSLFALGAVRGLGSSLSSQGAVASNAIESIHEGASNRGARGAQGPATAGMAASPTESSRPSSGPSSETTSAAPKAIGAEKAVTEGPGVGFYAPLALAFLLAFAAWRIATRGSLSSKSSS
jgi:hypothetical protein